MLIRIRCIENGTKFLRIWNQVLRNHQFTQKYFFEVRGPEIRFFGGVDRAVLSRIAAPSQLRAGPAREIGKNRVLASSAELRPSVYSWFGFQNLREFLEIP